MIESNNDYLGQPTPALTELDELENINNKNEFYNLSNCKYIYPEGITDKGFSILSLNVRSIKKNFNNLKDLTNNLNQLIDVIILNETWDTKHLNFSLNQYQQPITINREHKRGGGICIFVKDQLNYKVVHNTMIVNEHIECVMIKIEHRIILATYRPPSGNKTIFINKITELITPYLDKEINIAGDFNIDLADEVHYEKIFNLGILPTIYKYTRISTHSATIIDNILTNDKTRQGYIIPCSFTDHFAIIKTSTTRINTNIKTSLTRNFSKQNIQKLKDHLQNTNWNDILNNNNTINASESFHSKLVNAYNTCIPLKESKKRKNKTEQWYTAGIRNSEKIERKLYTKKCANPTPVNIKKHREYKSHLDKIKRKAKRNFTYERFRRANNDARKTWEIIKETTQKKGKSELSDHFKIQNKETDNKDEIANEFNRYFNQIGNKLATKIKEPKKSYIEYSKKCKTNKTFKFTPTTTTEIINIGRKLKPKSSCGPDNIPSRILKEIIPDIAKPLKHIINLSLESGNVPSFLKESTIVPIYKDGDMTDLGNHRPISLLNSISKIYEKIVHKQLYNYLVNNDILTDKQFGFRNNSSCEHAMTNLLNNIEDNLKNKLITNLIFIDLSKAFDTISFDILLHKLRNYGIKNTELNWFRNYLTDRKHRTNFKTTLSDILISMTGVPQGSILGPLLFLIYINDLADNVKGTLLYADDTTIQTQDENPNKLTKDTNNKLETAVDWFKANKLTLNNKKTRSMTICKGTTPNLNIKLDNDYITEISNNSSEKYFKFLGFRMDNKLTWKHHIEHVEKKLNIANYILATTKNSYPKHVKRMIYMALGQSHIEYGLPIWFNNNLNKITKIQKKAIRNICSQKYNAHTLPLFGENRLLKINDLYEIATIRLIKKSHLGKTPKPITEIFKKHTQERQLRPQNNIKVSTYGRISHDLPKIWNNLNDSLKSNNTSYRTLLRTVKNNIFTIYNNFNCNKETCNSCT